MTCRRLTVVPEPSARTEREELGDEEWLRQMVDVSRQLCDAIDRYIGPEHPAPRPRLTVLRGGGDDQ